jgi:hypothetical protein
MTGRMKAFLFAVILGCVLGAIVFADEDEYGQPVYYPGICIVLEPFSKWWIFFDCWGTSGGLMAETVTLTQSDDVLTTEIERTHKDGSVTRLVREQRRKK